MSDRVRLELKRSAAIELRDVVPAEQRGLALVPSERRPSVGHARRDENGSPEPVLGQHRERVLADVQVAVVEVEADGALGQLAGLQQVGHLDDVENLVSGRGEVLHLLAKAPRMYR